MQVNKVQILDSILTSYASNAQAFNSFSSPDELFAFLVESNNMFETYLNTLIKYLQEDLGLVRNGQTQNIRKTIAFTSLSFEMFMGRKGRGKFHMPIILKFEKEENLDTQYENFIKFIGKTLSNFTKKEYKQEAKYFEHFIAYDISNFDTYKNVSDGVIASNESSEANSDDCLEDCDCLDNSDEFIENYATANVFEIQSTVKEYAESALQIRDNESEREIKNFFEKEIFSLFKGENKNIFMDIFVERLPAQEIANKYNINKNIVYIKTSRMKQQMRIADIKSKYRRYIDQINTFPQSPKICYSLD